MKNYDWHGAFAAYAAEHPNVGEPTGPPAYIPDDFAAAVQAGHRHVLVWTGGSEVTAVPRIEQTHYPLTGPQLAWWADPALLEDLDTGQQLKDLLPIYDRPDAEVMADRQLPEIAVWAVKNGLQAAGFLLQHPAPRGSSLGWVSWPAGVPLPTDWPA